LLDKRAPEIRGKVVSNPISMLLRNLLADKDISSIRVASYPVLVTALINV